MKKLIILIICLLLLTSCDLGCSHKWEERVNEEDQTIYVCTVCNIESLEKVTGVIKVSEESWQELLDDENYMNVTIKNSYSNYDEEDTGLKHVDTIKIDSQRVSLSSAINAQVVEEEHRLSSISSIYLIQYYVGIIVNLVEDYNKFTFDYSKNAYIQNDEITFNLTIEFMLPIYYNIVIENAKIKLNNDGLIKSIECVYAETKLDNDEITSVKHNMLLELSNYNDTEVDDGYITGVYSYLDLVVTLPEGFRVNDEDGLAIAVSESYPIDGDNIVIYIAPSENPNLFTESYFDEQFASMFENYQGLSSYSKYDVENATIIKVGLTTEIYGVSMLQYQLMVFKNNATYVLTFTSVTGKYMDAFIECMNTIQIK